MEIFHQLLYNKALMIPVLSFCLAQIIKILTEVVKQKRIDFTRFVGSGGMPSSHSAFVTALAMSVGKLQGWDSPMFGLAMVFALIVMYDAAGVRRAAGRQAQVLNKIIEETMEGKPHYDTRLKELLGHSPFEVFVGAILGAVVAWYLV